MPEVASRSNLPQGDDIPEAAKFGLEDVAMVLLALVSVTLVFLDIFFRGFLYQAGIFTAVIVADALITAVFLIEFLYKARQERSLGVAARKYWFDLLGMIPMLAFVALEAAVAGTPFMAAVMGEVRLTGAVGAGGALRFFRFVRVIRIATAWSRFLRATNMTFGEQVTKRVFDKYRRIIVAELTTPILVAGITVSQEIIIRMKFLDSAGQALDAKRPEIHAAVVEALRKNNVPESVITKPLVEKIVNQVETTVVNTMVETLTGPELNKLTQELIVEVLQNFKDQLQSEEGKAALKSMDFGASPSKTIKPARASAVPDGPSAASAAPARNASDGVMRPKSTVMRFPDDPRK